MLALNPTYGLTYDRAFGTAIGGAIDSDILALPNLFHGEPATNTDQHLNARLSGAKSFYEFYRAHGSLEVEFDPLELPSSWSRKSFLRQSSNSRAAFTYWMTRY